MGGGREQSRRLNAAALMIPVRPERNAEVFASLRGVSAAAAGLNNVSIDRSMTGPSDGGAHARKFPFFEGIARPPRALNDLATC